MLLGGYSERQHVGWSEEQRKGREKELKYLLVVFGRRKAKQRKEGKILCPCLKEEMQICKGCLAISDLENLNTNMTNILFLRDGYEKRGFYSSQLFMLSSLVLFQFLGSSVMFACETYSNLTTVCAQKLTSSLITGHFDCFYHSFGYVKKSEGMAHD